MLVIQCVFCKGSLKLKEMGMYIVLREWSMIVEWTTTKCVKYSSCCINPNNQEERKGERIIAY